MLDLNTINILKKQGHIIRSDNTLHGFTKARIVQLVRCLENNWAAALERCENQYKTLCGYHEKEKKYAWHDLRKNPNDLPEEEECVVLVSMNGRFGHTEYRHAPKEGYWIKSEGLFFGEEEINKLVEGWKHIEPFEVEP